MLATLKYLSWHPPRLSDHNSTLGRHAHAHLRKQIPISRISSPRTVWDRRIVEASSAMSVMGQTRKSSPRANVVRCSSNNGLNSDITACLKRATTGNESLATEAPK